MRELCTRFERASRGGPQADGLQESVEIPGNALVETIKAMALVLRKARVGGDWTQEAGGQGA
ncbi:MAG: hypothetical protein ACRD2A_04825 [Vicinamibacterales bacterium]